MLVCWGQGRAPCQTRGSLPIPGSLISGSVCSLIILIALNALLFYRLWALERTAHTFESWHSLALAKG